MFAPGQTTLRVPATETPEAGGHACARRPQDLICTATDAVTEDSVDPGVGTAVHAGQKEDDGQEVTCWWTMDHGQKLANVLQ